MGDVNLVINYIKWKQIKLSNKEAEIGIIDFLKHDLIMLSTKDTLEIQRHKHIES